MSRRALRSVNAALGWVTLWCVVLTSVLLWPLFKRGYLLTRDAVSTPRSYITPSALGIGDTTARAVPQDAFIAIVSQFMDGGMAVKILLFLALILAGLGAAGLGWYFLFPGTRGQAVSQGLVAATFAIWNPFVVERLLQGHWSLLVGYGALPWIGLTGAMVMPPGRYTRLTAWAALAASMAVAGFTPTGAIMGIMFAIISVGLPKRPIDVAELRLAIDHTSIPLKYWQRMLVVLGIGLLVTLPWLYPSFLQVAHNGPASLSDSAGISAFAVRGEGPLGSLGTFFSLISLGGIWNADVVPASRSTIFVFFALAFQLVLLGVGMWRFRRSKTRRLVYLWAGAALFITLLITFFSYPAGTGVAVWVVEHIPGAGLFRDTQKWMALMMPIYAVLMSACARAVYEYSYRHKVFGRRIDARGATALLCILIILMLPDAPSATGKHLQPIIYSSSWKEIIEAVDGSNGDMAVLPAGQLRVFERTGNRPVLDPASRLVPVEVLNADDLPVQMTRTVDGKEGRDTVVVHGENVHAHQVEQALLQGAPAGVLASLGVRWVLIENTVAPKVPDTLEFRNTLRGLEPVVTAPDLTLYRVPGIVSRDYSPTRWEWTFAITFHIVWLLLMVVGYTAMTWLIVKDRKRATEASQENV